MCHTPPIERAPSRMPIAMRQGLGLSKNFREVRYLPPTADLPAAIYHVPNTSPRRRPPTCQLPAATPTLSLCADGGADLVYVCM